MPGVLAAVRAISTRPGLTVGIEPILGSNDVNHLVSRLRGSPLIGVLIIILIVGLLVAGLQSAIGLRIGGLSSRLRRCCSPNSELPSHPGQHRGLSVPDPGGG